MAFLIKNNKKDIELNEAGFFSFSMPTHIWKNNGMSQLQNAIKSMNHTDNILKTRLCAKLNGKYYGIIGIYTPERFSGHIVNAEIDQSAPGDFSHAITLELLNEKFREGTVTPRQVDGWGLMSSPIVSEGDEDKYDDEQFITDKLVSVVKSKDEKWIVFRFELNDVLKSKHDSKARSAGISELKNLF